MSDDGFVDPGEPGELQGLMRAKDLLNKPCIFRPHPIQQGQGKDDAGNPQSYDYYPCDVWVLDRAGIVEHGTNVQVSWKRVMPQLSEKVGLFVAATPRRGDDNSITLQPFTDSGKEIARLAIKEIKSATTTDTAPEPEYAPGEEPF